MIFDFASLAYVLHTHTHTHTHRKTHIYRDYIKSPCDAGTETHYIYTPVGRCVNVTQAADYYYYYDTVVGSKISVCVDGNAEERTFKTADCKGDDFEKEITVNAMTCEANDVENSIAKRYQSVACTDVPAPVEPTPTPPPSESGGSYSSNINLAVTQVRCVNILLLSS